LSFGEYRDRIAPLNPYDGGCVPQNPTTTQATLKFIRTVHGTLMLTIVLYVVVMRVTAAQNVQPLDSPFLWSLAACAAVGLVVGQAIRLRYLRPAFEVLRVRQDDSESLVRWRKGVFFSDCFAEASVMYGFVIHELGGTDRQVAPFVIAGAAAMILWWPKEP
jgi:hypothetical protein